MDDETRINLSDVWVEYVRVTRQTPPTSSSQLRTWMVDGLLAELDPVRTVNGRWTVRRDRVPLLQEIAPRLIARAEDRMRHRYALRPAVAAA